MLIGANDLKADLLVFVESSTELYVTHATNCDEAAGLALGHSRTLADSSVIVRLGDRVVWLTGLPVVGAREEVKAA